MELEIRKLHFIEELLKVSKQDIMDELEEVRRLRGTTFAKKHDFTKIAVTMYDQDASEMLLIIEEGCEKYS